ncbi:hypothetical protein PLICRDRAFT_38060 [Plicaturopsis crispa FD-325 SS-3]|nr:hypothetical protein PLICRDRAFT_38060 [Plicaturopsis crispa FD-325 SS-3]
MPMISASVDAFLLSSALIVISYVFFARHYPNRPHALDIFVLLHTLFISHRLLLTQPPNLFRALHIPLTVPADYIRARLQQSADTPLPDALDALLSKLASFDVRQHYVRYGHPTILACSWCVTATDYMLFYIPQPLLQYVRTAAVVGVVSHTWRPWGTAVLIAAALLEGYWIMTVQFDVDSPNITMWHDRIYTLRHILLLILPILAALLPERAAIHTSPRALVARTKSLRERLTLLRLVQDTALRMGGGAMWERQRREGEVGRTDENVRRAAGRVGMHFDEGEAGGEGDGELRLKVREAVQKLVDGLKEDVRSTR